MLDVVDPESELAEEWAILETYLGAEVLLTPLSDYKTLFKEAGAKITKNVEGVLFQMMKLQF